MRRLGLDEWAGLSMLVVAGLVASPVLLGFGDTGPPLWLWWVLFLNFAAAVMLALTFEETPRRARVGIGVAVLLGWVLVLTAPEYGMLPILLVLLAAISTYIVALPVSLMMVLGNVAVITLATLLRTTSVVEVLVTGGLYLLIHLGTVFSTAAMLRERQMRLEAAASQVQLQAAAVLLEESARTRERLRISRDLHDLVGHQLTVLTLELEAARHKEGSAARGHVERANGVARQLLTDVRASVGSMRSQAPRLREEIERIVQDVPGLTVHTSVADDIDIGEEARTAVVRAVQEIVTNAIRHANASTVRISVTQAPDAVVHLTGSDDGRGAPKVRLGNGLRGMIERFDAAGGAVQTDGSDGFRVTAQVPGR